MSSLTLTTPNPLIQDVPLGIGIIKSVLLALTNGCSMMMVSVFPFQTNALLMLKMEIVLHALKDMTLRKENVSSLTSTTPSLMMQDVPLGIGIIKYA